MFLNVNGIRLYYEKTGSGRPVLLLHGNSMSHKIFDVLTGQLSDQYTVYAIDSRGHGKSSRVKQFNYVTMAEDMALFIKELNLQGAALYGFSDGGIIGLLLAIRYPELLSRLMISGANLHPEGVKTVYTVITRIVYLITRNRKFKLMLTQPDIKDEQLAGITVPTLVLAGSKDMIREDHTRHIAEQIPGSTLKILEGESHMSYVVHSKKMYSLIESFIAKDRDGVSPFR